MNPISKHLFFIIVSLTVSFFPLESIQAQCLTSTEISPFVGGFDCPLLESGLLGDSVEGIGDVDGDGIPDLLVSGKGSTNNGSGGVFVLFMNANGTVKDKQELNTYTGIEGLYNASALGGEDGLASLGDFDGDGIPDIAIGDWNWRDGSFTYGAVHIILLNADGTIKSQTLLTTEQNGIPSLPQVTNFGSAIANIGDFDGDGVTDIAVGAYGDSGLDPNFTSYGAIYILFLNADRTVKSHQKINELEGGFGGDLDLDDRFGSSITNLGDIDGDGVIDLAVGVPKDDDGGTQTGAVYILFMNADGTVKAEQKISDTEGGLQAKLVANNYFGQTVENIGDIDGDGITDIAVGAIGEANAGGNSWSGATYILLLNTDGTVKAETVISDAEGGLDISLELFDAFGSGIGLLGDIDGDGYTNLAISASTFFGEGAVYVIDIMYDGTEVVLQSECPASVVNQITSATTTACLNDMLPAITNSGFDLISEAGSTTFDGAETALFQWQISYDGTNWEDIADATTADLTTPIDFVPDTYIRRVYTNDCCSIVSNSNVLQFTQQGEAPEVSILPLHYCPGASESSVIDIELTGGTGTITYSWSPAAGLSNPNIAEPTVTFGTNDTYELTATGTDGCQTIATAIMIPIQADAGGSTVYICNDGGVEIGMSAIPGLSGVTYSWTLSGGGDASGTLSCVDCSNPIANPGSTTTYELTINDGNGCTNTDQVTVNPNAYQADAGSDVYVCRGTDVPIGTATQAGIFYGWSPGLYLDNQITAQPTFFSGVVPDSNPYQYTLTTFDPSSGDCYSIDTLLAHVAWADAGLDDVTTVCLEPEQIGTPDCCNGQATYAWTIVSGDANSFYDPLTMTYSNTSNIPQPYVLPTTQLTTYQVSVTWGPNADNSGGANCTDLRFIEPGCGTGCPVMDVTFDNTVSCGVGTMGTIMEAALDTAYWDLVWTSVDGTDNLSCTDCANPTLLADVTADITYTLTYTSRIDNSVSCFFNVDVYDSNTGLPTPLAQDGIACSGTGVQIGNSPVAGWSYDWMPITGLSSSTSSNPTASPTVTTSYALVVTDDVTGCTAETTITVYIFDETDLVQPDMTACGGQGVQIGTLGQTGYTYSWSPGTGLDNANIANPIATLSAGFGSQTYNLTVTSPNGCNATASMTLTETSSFSVTLDNVSMCEDGNVSLNADVSGAEDGLVYSWSPTSGLSCTDCPNPVVSGLTTNTSYSVSVTASGGGCLGTDNALVTILSPPSVSLSNVPLCMGSVQIGTIPVANHSYSWVPTTGLDDPNIANPMASPSSTTTYTLIIVDANGCFDSFEQTVNVTAPQVNAGTDLTICEGGEITIGATSALVGVTYSWSPTIGLDDPSAAQTIARPDVTTIYTLTATNSSGAMCAAVDGIEVTVTPEPVNVPTLDPFVIICENACQTIGVADNPAYEYQWLPAAAVTSPTSSLTEICPTANTSLSLVITDPSTGCSKTQDMDIYLTAGGNCPIFDWGDLPDISSSTNTNDYQTSASNNGPVHQIISGLSLGSIVDEEIDGQPSTDALGDGGDEDGLIIYPSLGLYPNMTFRLPFSYINTTGNTAHVEAWIDWNGDGDFDEVGEMVVDWNDGAGALPDRIEIAIPATAQTGIFLGYRIRISNQDNMTPYGLQPNGEIEDYLIEIGCPQVCLPIQATVIRQE